MKKDQAQISRNTPTPTQTSSGNLGKPKKLTKAQVQEQAYWLARGHSCDGLAVCSGLVDKLMRIIGDQITLKELDKFRIPCATVQAMHAASQMTNLDLAKHDEQESLEVYQPTEVLVEEGAEEPNPVKKDSCQQHSRMLKYKASVVPSLSLKNYDRRENRGSRLRSQKSIKKRKSNHSVTSESPSKTSRRGTLLTMNQNQTGGYTTFTAQKSSISSQENNRMTMLNLKEFSARKGSQNITIDSGSGRLRAALASESTRAVNPWLVKILVRFTVHIYSIKQGG